MQEPSNSGIYIPQCCHVSHPTNKPVISVFSSLDFQTVNSFLQNNFSPTCAAVGEAAFAESKFDKYSIAPDEYVCDACPRGYAGSHCERSVIHRDGNLAIQ